MLLFDGLPYALDQRFCRLPPGKLTDDERVLRAFLDNRAYLYAPKSVIVFARIHHATQLEIGKERNGLLPQNSYLRLQQLREVVRQNRGRESDSNTFRPHHQEKRQLAR